MDLCYRVSTNRARRSRTELKQKRVRKLRFEQCEGRIMMSASALSYGRPSLAGVAGLSALHKAGVVASPSSVTTPTLTAYRPQETSGANPYAPFAKTAVAEGDEATLNNGPGIRIDGDKNNVNLIEVTVAVPSGGTSYVLQQGGVLPGDINNALNVWTSPTEGPGQAIVFDKMTHETTLTFPAGITQETVWVEWALPNQGHSSLTIQPGTGSADTLEFHTFTSVAFAIGGETFSSNPPPPDPTYGVWKVGAQLYSEGYDVYLANEGYVNADYNAIKNAIQNQGVSQVAIFGYSHGGGDTYTLANQLSTGTKIGNFSIAFTAYVDAIRNNSDFDTQAEALRPPGSLFHVNYYRGSGILSELFLHGVPTQGTIPLGSGAGFQQNVQTQPWGQKATHTGATGISLLPEVQTGIEYYFGKYVSV